VSLADVQKVFCTTPAWTSLWPKAVQLLKAPEFKEVIYHDRNLLAPEDDLLEYTSKLELGCLALLWCQGSHDDKADFLY